MFRLIQRSSCGGDGTAAYDICLNGNYTVGEFILDVLDKYPNEFGHIGIVDYKSVYGDPCTEYDCGKLEKYMPQDFLGKKVLSANASGGWGRMDYWLKID